MDRACRGRVRGFTTVELMIVVAIVAVLASIGIRAMRDYARRASLSEVVLATTSCKQAVAENYAILTDAPDAGRWGCETSKGTGRYTGKVETSSNGVIRIAITGLDGLVNGQFIYLAPAHTNGGAMVTPDDLGRNVKNWICGSDWLPVRNSLPANCRTDTTTFASQEFQ